MKRREFILALGGTVAWPVVARAQANRVPRVGVLSLRPMPSIYVETFLQGLRDLGYVEGQNIIVEYRAHQDVGVSDHPHR